MLGDNPHRNNIFLPLLQRASQCDEGATVSANHVHDPERYGGVGFEVCRRAISIEEKPSQPKDPNAVTGLYLYDDQSCHIAAAIKPNAPSKLDMTETNAQHLHWGQLSVEIMGRGYSWLETGSNDSLLEASSYIATPEKRHGARRRPAPGRWRGASAVLTVRSSSGWSSPC